MLYMDIYNYVNLNEEMVNGNPFFQVRQDFLGLFK
jgi:hypothetical protein